MRLHVEEHGSGERTIVLLHGLMGSGESWWRVTELLVARGRRVLAIDLPGHGRSPRDPDATVPRIAAAIDATLAIERSVDVGIGHSFGGLVLGATGFGRALAVHVDAPFRSRGGWDRAATRAEYAEAAAGRSAAELARTRPHYSPRDRAVEERAAAAFDPDTAAAVASAPGGAWWPSPRSVVLRADPSRYVSDEDAALLTDRGVQVRGIPGASHSVWVSHFDDFVAALPEVFGA